LHRSLIFGLLVGIFIFGCTQTPTEVASAPTDTPQGPVVPTRAPTLTASITHTPTDTPVPPTDTLTPTEAPSDTPSNTPTFTHTSTVLPSDTPSQTSTQIPSDTPSNTPTAQATQIQQPTNTPASSDTTATFTAPATPGSENQFTDSTAFLPVSLESPISAFSPISGTIDNDHPAKLYTYEGLEDEVLNIAMQSTGGNLDPFLLVIDPKGRELARNDDESTESLDASIRGLRLPESGTYVIAASRYGQQFGSSSGDFELRVSKASSSETPFGLFSQLLAYDVDATNTIDDDTPVYAYTFRGNEGDTISIQMSATSGDLDSRLTLTDNLGNTLISNDDDLVNLIIDSYIQDYVLPASGYYTIVATRYGGAPNSGDFRLTVTLEEPGTLDAIHPIVAVLDPENSRTLRADGQFFSNFSAGDSVDADKNELRTETLLTFFLPPLPEGTTLESAEFDLSPCYESGSGFNVLGNLTIYHDNYGALTQSRDFTRPAAGSRILTEMGACEMLDVTDVVREIYASGNDTLQLRLTFRNTTSNGQGDEVLFTPHLILNPA
jgi:hypothetical protein